MSAHDTITRRAFIAAGAATAVSATFDGVCVANESGLDVGAGDHALCAIVIRQFASESEKYAAAELQHYMFEVTGTTLPIVTDANRMPDRAILLGATRHSGELLNSSLHLAKLGDDGFRFVGRHSHFLIVAGPVRGVLYGVYELLERYAGCRWYASFHSVVPRRKVVELPIIDEINTPAFEIREPAWFDMIGGDFAARCRINGSGMKLQSKHGGSVRFGVPNYFVHTAYRLVPPERYFERHPEYFAEVGGRRQRNYAQLCWSNTQLPEVIAENLTAAIRADPGARLFSVSQNDFGNNCTCDKCRAIDFKEGSPSGSLLTCVNAVAKAITSEFPKVLIETLAFQHTQRPPKYLRPRANVVPRLCSINCDFSRPLVGSDFVENATFVADLGRWADISKRLCVWDYSTNFIHYPAPFPNFEALRGNIKLYRDKRVMGVYIEGDYNGPHGEFAELRGWLLSKLLWNPDFNIPRLLDDFFAGYYGLAAEPMRNYFDDMQARIKLGQQRLFVLSTSAAPEFGDAFYKRALDLVTEAERRVKDDAGTLFRVRMAGVPAFYARVLRWRSMPTRRVVRNDTLRRSGLDSEFLVLANELRTRLEAGGIRVSESGEVHKSFMAWLSDQTLGQKLTLLKKGRLIAGVSSAQGATLYSLRRDKQEYLCPGLGGVDVLWEPSVFDAIDKNAWVERSLDDASAKYVTRSGDERRFQVAETALSVATSCIPQTTLPPLTGQVMRIGLDLGDRDAVAIRSGNGGPWQLLQVPEAQVTAAHYIVPSAEVILASPTTQRAMKLKFNGVTPERMLAIYDTEQQGVRVYAAGKGIIKSPGPFAWELELVPIEKPAGVPRVIAHQQHRAERVVVENCFLPLGRPGTWGDVVADSQSDCGFALRLFGTHNEWCLQWRVRPEIFIPGRRYAAELLVRIDRNDLDSHAFSAGIYDIGKNHIFAQIQPMARDVRHGYQWHSIGTWAPADNQFIWVAPMPNKLGNSEFVGPNVHVGRLAFQVTA